MATITVKINHKPFPIACENGQEALVEKAALKLVERYDQLKAASPTAPFEYILVLCAISMQNEIFNLKQQGNSDFTKDYESLEKSLKEIEQIVEALK